MGSAAVKNYLLIIDDDESVREAISDSVTQSNYELLTAVNGEEGLKAYDLYNPAVMIVDLRMPVLSGIDFIKEVKKRKSLDVNSIIVLTGHGDDDDLEQCYELGINAFLKKPFNLYELNGLVDQAVKIRIDFDRRQIINDVLSIAIETLSFKQKMRKILDLLISSSGLDVEQKWLMCLSDELDSQVHFFDCKGFSEEEKKGFSSSEKPKCRCGIPDLGETSELYTWIEPGQHINFSLKSTDNRLLGILHLFNLKSEKLIC
jgi:DNA-binding response OmpR family regulator